MKQTLHWRGGETKLHSAVSIKDIRFLSSPTVMSFGSGTVAANEVNKRLTREKDRSLPFSYACGKQPRDHCESDCRALVPWTARACFATHISCTHICCSYRKKEKRGASISLQVVRKRKSSLVLTDSTTPFQPPIPMHDETPRAMYSRQPPPITCFLHSHQICFSTRRFGYRTRGPSRKRNLVQACLWRSIGVRVINFYGMGLVDRIGIK